MLTSIWNNSMRDHTRLNIISQKLNEQWSLQKNDYIMQIQNYFAKMSEILIVEYLTGMG